MNLRHESTGYIQTLESIYLDRKSQAHAEFNLCQKQNMPGKFISSLIENLFWKVFSTVCSQSTE